MRDLFGVNIRKTPIEAEDGRYPDGTFAQMLCKNVAGQDKETGNRWILQQWQVGNIQS